ncbi:MAG: ECF transporter S component [Erysipelotrichales bacterium]
MKKNRELAFSSMIVAIILVMAIVPFLGFIQIGLVTITLIHIPVLVGSLTFKNRNLALSSGLAFGLSSWVIALSRPSAPTDYVFQNPIVSVIPRVLFALLAFYLYMALSKKLKNETLSLGISIVVSTLFHTISVLSLMYIFGKNTFEGGLIKLIVATMAANGIIEIVLAVAIVIPVVIALRKAIKIK